RICEFGFGRNTTSCTTPAIFQAASTVNPYHPQGPAREHSISGIQKIMTSFVSGCAWPLMFDPKTTIMWEGICKWSFAAASVDPVRQLAIPEANLDRIPLEQPMRLIDFKPEAFGTDMSTSRQSRLIPWSWVFSRLSIRSGESFGMATGSVSWAAPPWEASLVREIIDWGSTESRRI